MCTVCILQGGLSAQARPLYAYLTGGGGGGTCASSVLGGRVDVAEVKVGYRPRGFPPERRARDRLVRQLVDVDVLKFRPVIDAGGPDASNVQVRTAERILQG